MKHASLVAFLALTTAFSELPAEEETQISYSREIRPLLSDRCFKCHGFDEEKREADLALNSFAGATRDLGGYAAIDLKNPEDSELLFRITSDDRDEIMPPPSSNKPAFSKKEVELIRKWIRLGAKYEKHWAFVAPIRPPPPPDQSASHPIDKFIDQKIEDRRVPKNSRANPFTLLRRLSLDFRGFPPNLKESESFVADYKKNPEKTWLRWVDQFLASPAYGEKWSREWLDLARYSDTNGYEKDRPRSIWPYRDWVIHALNDDMPYDQFSIEQIAGDLLPNATESNLVATGFHRNTMLNEEGGIDPLEYRFHAMVDRVATTGTVWMGLTIGCAQCHTHKFDPITHGEYFSLMALLNNADEPEIEVSDPAILDRRREISRQIEELENQAIAAIPEPEFNSWKSDLLKKDLPRWVELKPAAAEADLPKLTILEDHSILASGDFTKREVYRVRFEDFSQLKKASVTALRLEVLPHDSLPAKGPGVAFYEGRKGDFFLSELTAKTGGEKLAFNAASTNFGKISIGKGAAAGNVYDGNGSTGWSTAGREGETHHLYVNLEKPVPLSELDLELLFERHFVAALGRFRLSATTHTGEVKADLLGIPDPNKATKREWQLAFIEQSKLPSMAGWKKKIDAKRAALPSLPTTLVMRERPRDNPRPTFRHHRGEYISPKEKVHPAVPGVFPPLPRGEPANRLTFAKWLVSEKNPLAARVAVNRAWRSIFGRGIVATEGDFGYQSVPPTHPELLDWLAVEFRERGWSMKSLHRLIVTSEVYRRDSSASEKQTEVDPKNELLARGPRFRLTGEVIRDSALQVSGLLHQKLGGPSVRPPQPPGVTELAYGKVKWNPSAGPDRYRRSLYTFSKRTAPFAAYLTFDGPTGENCIPRRERSNTPLQALTLLNDEMFFEAARGLAKAEFSRLKRVQSPIEEGTIGHSRGYNRRLKRVQSPIKEGTIDHSRGYNRRKLDTIFRRVLTRPPKSEELDRLEKFFITQKKRFSSGELDPKTILPGEKEPSEELAALTLAARVLLNLHEAITKE